MEDHFSHRYRTSHNRMNDEVSDQLCLKWTKHSDNITRCFESFYENEAMVDVTLFTEGKMIKAHKMILSACSPYFETMFMQTVDKHPVVVLKDVSFPHLSLMMDFMYRGEVNVAHEELTTFLDTAKNLCIKGLTDNIDISRDPITTQLIRTSSQRRHNESSPKYRNNFDKIHNSPSLDHKSMRRMPDLYSPPSSMPSVLSKALTMPPSLHLASPLGMPHLSSLPATLASSLANVHSMPGSFNHPSNTCLPPMRPSFSESPCAKRRRKYRKSSGEVNVESGDSDCPSSSSPGDSNLHFPKIPATITPINKHPPPPMSHHSNGIHLPFTSDLQPKDLSINSQKVNCDEPLALNSPRLPSITKSSPVMIPHLLPTTNIEYRRKNEHDISDHDQSSHNHHSLKSESSHESSDSGSSPKTEKNDLSHRSDDLVDKNLSKIGSSDPESMTSPSKHHETMSDQDVKSEEENEESSSATKKRYFNSIPGPSASRSHSEEEPHTSNYLSSWPYVNPDNQNEDGVSNSLNENMTGGLWKNNFKGGLLAPYLGSFGSLSSPHGGFASTFPGLYAVTGNATTNWSKNTNSPPGLSLPQQLRLNECTRCGKLYKTRKGLKHHVKNECGVEPRFHCTHCDWKFKQKAHLLRHMARKHTVS